MNNNLRCQSCGMPLGAGYFGTESNSTETHEYCKFCYQNGLFTQPELTVQDMIKISVDHMMTELNIPEAESKQLAADFIPNLRRWQK